MWQEEQMERPCGRVGCAEFRKLGSRTAGSSCGGPVMSGRIFEALVRIEDFI